MLTEIYIDALLVDGELADQVWVAWNLGELSDREVLVAWMLVAHYGSRRFRLIFRIPDGNKSKKSR